MNLRPMADALAPLRSQMQQKVHEREILRVFATVQGHDAAATMDTAKRDTRLDSESIWRTVASVKHGTGRAL